MSRENRPSPPRNSGKRGMNPMFIGIMIGMLLGICMALGVALWLNRSSNPFVEKTKPVESLSKNQPASPPKLESTAPDIGQARSAATPDKPRFEFYDLLQGDKAGKDNASAKASPKATPVATLPEKKAADVSAPVPAPVPTSTAVATPKETYMLQAGAFQNESDAENLKAKIAFAGLEAHIKPVNVQPKGTLYRVRLGPYRGQDEVNKIKAVLSQNGIDASIVKSSDGN